MVSQENAAQVAAPDPEIVDPTPEAPPFDLMGVDSPSFAVLAQGRRQVFATREDRSSFERLVRDLPDTGEDGRRKGLGLWLLGDHQACVDQLAKYDSDDVATFTRTKALMCLQRPEEAIVLFERLSAAYPDEPRPRGGLLEAQLERDLAAGGDDTSAALTNLEAGLLAAPESFGASAEGHYLRGRLAELARDWESALDHYQHARETDPTLREAHFRRGYLAERCGLDEEALEAYEALAELLPVDRRAVMNLGVLYEDLGRDQDAAACYDVVVKNRPTDERARMYLRDAESAMDMYYDEDLERKEDRLNQILRIPITDFELSVRARNCLNKMEINTLGDLVSRTEQELLSYKNFGETSLDEIKEILHSKGLRLGMPRDEAVASIEAHGRRPASGGSDLLDQPISALQLSIRARRTVETVGCLTVGDITKHSTQELLGMPNFGVTSLQELRAKLGELGLKLRGD